MLRKADTWLKAFFKYQLFLQKSFLQQSFCSRWGCTHACVAVVGWPCLDVRCHQSSSLPALLSWPGHRKRDKRLTGWDMAGEQPPWAQLVGCTLGPAATSSSRGGNFSQKTPLNPPCYQNLATQTLHNRSWQHAAHPCLEPLYHGHHSGSNSQDLSRFTRGLLLPSFQSYFLTPHCWYKDSYWTAKMKIKFYSVVLPFLS